MYLDIRRDNDDDYDWNLATKITMSNMMMKNMC